MIKKKLFLKGRSQAKYLDLGMPSRQSIFIRAGKKKKTNINYVRIGSKFSRSGKDNIVETVKVTGFSHNNKNIPHIFYDFYISNLSLDDFENARSLSAETFMKLFNHRVN